MQRLVIGVVVLFAACKPSYGVLVLLDPDHLAVEAARLEVTLVSSARTHALAVDGIDGEFSITMEGGERRSTQLVRAVAFDSVGGELAVANARQLFGRGGPETKADLRRVCDADTPWGSACSRADGTGLGVCADGACGDSRCGDGAVDSGEACDAGAGNLLVASEGECRLDCTIAARGDGVVDADEQCDDGNAVDIDSCRFGQLAECGDGVVWEGVEDCDAGPAAVTPPCSYGDTACQVCSAERCLLVPGATSYCGDGIVDGMSAELCDDGNTMSGDGCSASCNFVVWETVLGSAVGTRSLVAVDGVELGGDIEQLRNIDVAPRPQLLAIATNDGRLNALDATAGEVLWSYQAGASVSSAHHDRGALVFLTTDGVAHWVSAAGPAASAPIVKSLGPTSGDVEPVLGAAPGVAPALNFTVAADRTMYSWGLDALGDPVVHMRALDDDCAGCALCVGCEASGIGGTLRWLPMEDQVLFYDQSHCTNALDTRVTLAAGEWIVGPVTFTGNGTPHVGGGQPLLDSGDLALGTTTRGNVVRLPFLEGHTCGSTRAAEILYGPDLDPLHPPARSPPLILPIGGFTFLFIADGGQVWRGNVGLSNRLERLWSTPDGAELVGTGALDVEGFFYIGDASNRLHRLQAISGDLDWSLTLPGPVIGSPLVADAIVYVATENGTVLALERGGAGVPYLGGWVRRRGDNQNAMAVSCSAMPSGWPAAITLLLAAWRRRRT